MPGGSLEVLRAFLSYWLWQRTCMIHLTWFHLPPRPPRPHAVSPQSLAGKGPVLDFRRALDIRPTGQMSLRIVGSEHRLDTTQGQCPLAKF